jgi:hypothetical protein
MRPPNEAKLGGLVDAMRRKWESTTMVHDFDANDCSVAVGARGYWWYVPFFLCLSHVFSRQEVTIEKRLQIGEIDLMLVEIGTPLGFIPGDHGPHCICACISA